MNLQLKLASVHLTSAQRPSANPSRPLRALAALLFLLSPALALAQTPTTQTDQTDRLAEARSLLRQNSLPAAEAALHTYLTSAPGSSEGHYLLGLILHRENKPRESLAAYTEAAAITPPHSEDLRIVALDYVLLNDYPDAIHWLGRSLALDPRNAEAWYDLGRAHMSGGDFVAAEHDFSRTLALHPAHARALDNLGLSLEAQNRTDEALSAYTRAIAAQASSPHPSEQPLLNLATLLNSKARSAEAVKPLEQAIAIAPNCPRCHEELSRACMAIGQDARATAEMEQAVALDPKNPRFHFQLGQIYRRSGLSAKADAELKTSASLYGSHSTATDR